jgi:hypothetical protein
VIWAAPLLAWLLAGLVLEALAWRAHRLAGLAPLPQFHADPVHAATARVAFLGDVQRGVSGVAKDLPRRLEAFGAHLLVSGGDLVAHGEAPYYGVFVAAMGRHGLGTPARAVPGNHDLEPRGVRDPGPGRALFERHFGPVPFAARVGPALVVGLDDATGWGEDQVPFLEEAVRAHGGPWMAVLHRPPRRVDRPDLEPDPVQRPLVSALERLRPLVVVCGHEHAYDDRTIGGVRYVVNAHGGDVRGPWDLVLVTVSADGTATLERATFPRRRDVATLLDQAAVQAWSVRRRGVGRLVALPAAALLKALGLRAPEAAIERGSP